MMIQIDDAINMMTLIDEAITEMQVSMMYVPLLNVMGPQTTYHIKYQIRLKYNTRYNEFCNANWGKTCYLYIKDNYNKEDSITF